MGGIFMKRIKLRKLIPVLIIIAFSVSVSSIYAFFTDIAFIPVSAAGGSVSISADMEDSVHDRLLRLFEVPESIFPGDVLHKGASVSSSGIDCFVRVRIETDLTGIPDIYECCGIDTSKWKRIGDYIYLLSPLTEQNNKSIVFNRIHIPETIGNENSGGHFYVRLTAEAIQAHGIFPDFNSSDPWSGIQADISIAEESEYL